MANPPSRFSKSLVGLAAVVNDSMPRSHPPTLTTLVGRTLREECGPLQSQAVLAAVSGGGDSQAMLEVLARWSSKLGFSLLAHGVDHGLRAEAARELDLAEELAGRLGIPFARTKVAVKPGGNLQARARDARYAVLREVAGQHGALIATAHHADDRAETVLLRLLRGSGPRGLAVLPPRAESSIRPLLRAAKSDVLLHLQRHRIPFAEDPSNLDVTFLRVRVRRELLPLLSQLSPQIVRHLNALADALSGTGLPAVEGAEGAPELNRAQLQQALRASRMGRSIAIRVAGAGDVLLGSRTPKATTAADSGAEPVKRPRKSKR